ncbi:hypothetical protein APHWI1_0524 [Anaplasma phagocytophilum str. ApWI1]|uniref:Uncharacterized protein n=2 Tax=Anaplasma phagocytophilum TaxID=948 RepID=A0A0F3N4D7_ANAPH|nr:hypothetical protein APHWEB_0988 [Anaplasma phagocytophilum str. Webster]KJV62953.1 hypothetical protein EPHNCH_1340 [Anaplasma phagocytophilum str. NCH-1]KJV84235.1 hypothetical protein APHWI1_0524 [Anaplasma phagocytophilum str. ApWI1]KJV87053.1 hypothetical protein APHNYW_1036 [Anaplasma phagocytophilum str. ApNYW]KJV98218.1 hypothetical protein OTSANNIE_1293 [Anaplasma phagocytophilum str. Annie]
MVIDFFTLDIWSAVGFVRLLDRCTVGKGDNRGLYCCAVLPLL